VRSPLFSSIEHELIDRVSPQELEFQETLIAEREAEIREIESGIHELNDIFRDLGTIVQEQGGLIGKSPPLLHLSHTLRLPPLSCSSSPDGG
jgi:hypothetical protein